MVSFLSLPGGVSAKILYESCLVVEESVPSPADYDYLPYNRLGVIARREEYTPLHTGNRALRCSKLGNKLV